MQIEPSRADAKWIPQPAQFIEKGRSINGLPQYRGIQTKDFSLARNAAALPDIAREIRRAGCGSHRRGIIALAISAAMQSGVHGGMRQPAERGVDGNCGMRVISKARLFMAMTHPLGGEDMEIAQESCATALRTI